MADIEIEIDGQTLKAQPNQTVIQVADAANIYIPRFCYHKHLSIPANCRMCLVEVEKMPKAVPACATPVMPGMKVFTKSAKTLSAQRAVMEFLLVNHPLDCPVCDQGGECELQDLSMGYGSSHSEYTECKRSIPIEDLGPLVASEMTRCIACTRCVRFGDEIAGKREIGATFRGEHTEIGTYIKSAVTSEVSGNIIDLCPVGALTSKPYRFSARAWELQQAPSISPHDCWGSNLNVHTRYGEVKRVVSRENMAVNQTWISDRDRFGYSGLYHEDRLKEPQIKIQGVWHTVSWQRAFEAVAEQLHAALEKDPEQLGALASPNSTLEEFYLLQKLVRGLGSSNIDYRLRMSNTEDQAELPRFLGFNAPLSTLDEADAVVLIGSNLSKEQPLAAVRLRSAVKKGANVVAINPVDYEFNFKVNTKHIVAPHLLPNELAKLVLDANSVLNTALKEKQKVVILLGALALHHPQAAIIRQIAQKLAGQCQATLGYLTDGANAAGGALAGALPHRGPGGVAVDKVGLSADAMWKNPRKAYLLLNVEPDDDCNHPAQVAAALAKAETVIALSVYRNALLEEQADVILPLTPFTETAGTFVNTQGIAQAFAGVAKPLGSARPGWKILRVLGNFLHVDGFDYESIEDIRNEYDALINSVSVPEPSPFPYIDSQVQTQTTLSRIGEIPLYSLDGLVRRAKPLQNMQALMEGDVSQLRIHPETGASLRLTPGGKAKVKQAGSASVTLPVIYDERIAKSAVWVAGGIAATRQLGDLLGEIEVQPA